MRAEGENLSRARAHRMLLSSCRRVCEPARNSSHLRAMLEGSGQRAHICTGCMHWQLAPRPAHAHTSSTRTHQTVTNSARTRTRTHTLAYSAHTHACAPSHPLLLGVLDTHTHMHQAIYKLHTHTCAHARLPTCWFKGQGPSHTPSSSASMALAGGCLLTAPSAHSTLAASMGLHAAAGACILRVRMSVHRERGECTHRQAHWLVCVYVYIRVYVYVCARACVCEFARACARMCVCACARVYMYACAHMPCVCRMSECVCARSFAYICLRMLCNCTFYLVAIRALKCMQSCMCHLWRACASVRFRRGVHAPTCAMLAARQRGKHRTESGVAWVKA